MIYPSARFLCLLCNPFRLLLFPSHVRKLPPPVLLLLLGGLYPSEDAALAAQRGKHTGDQRIRHGAVHGKQHDHGNRKYRQTQKDDQQNKVHGSHALLPAFRLCLRSLSRHVSPP
jgi:hypothetical protein